MQPVKIGGRQLPARFCLYKSKFEGVSVILKLYFDQNILTSGRFHFRSRVQFLAVLEIRQIL